MTHKNIWQEPKERFYLLYKTDGVNLDTRLPTPRLSPDGELLWRTHPAKVRNAFPSNMHEFIREHGNKFQYVLYRGWNNHLNDATQPLRKWERDIVAGVERTLQEDAPTLIEDVQVNVPTLLDSFSPIDGVEDVLIVPAKKAHNLLGGNVIAGNAVVDPSTVKMDYGINLYSGHFKNSRLNGSGFQSSPAMGKQEITVQNTDVRNSYTLEHFSTLDARNSKLCYLGASSHELPNALVCENTKINHLYLQGGKLEAKGTKPSIDTAYVRNGASVKVDGSVAIFKSVFNSGTFDIRGKLSISASSFVGAMSLDVHHSMCLDDLVAAWWGKAEGKVMTINTQARIPYTLSRILKHHPGESLTSAEQGEIIRQTANDAYRLSARLLSVGATVHKFCVAPDIHANSGCVCGLAYPLLLAGHSVGILYFLRAAGMSSSASDEHNAYSDAELTHMVKEAILSASNIYDLWSLTELYWTDECNFTSVRERIFEFCGVSDFERFAGSLTDSTPAQYLSAPDKGFLGSED
jgi:hypothetical protein